MICDWKVPARVFDSTRHLGAIVVGMILQVPTIGTPDAAQLEAHDYGGYDDVSKSSSNMVPETQPPI